MTELARLDVTAGIARLTLDRPERLNAFNIDLHRDVRAKLDIVERDDRIRVLILTGAGRAFCAGQDLNERFAMLNEGEVDLGESLNNNYNPLVRRLATLPIPVIAAVNGAAVGAGAALAIACDLVLVARSAQLQFPFAKVGLGPDAGTSWRLPRLVGYGRALALCLTGESVTAEEAVRIGLAWKMAEDETLEEDAYALASQLAAGSRVALATTKRHLWAAPRAGFEEALDAERDAQAALGRHSDYREAVTAFVQKRAPKFAGAVTVDQGGGFDKPSGSDFIMDPDPIEPDPGGDPAVAHAIIGAFMVHCSLLEYRVSQLIARWFCTDDKQKYLSYVLHGMTFGQMKPIVVERLARYHPDPSEINAVMSAIEPIIERRNLVTSGLLTRPRGEVGYCVRSFSGGRILTAPDADDIILVNELPQWTQRAIELADSLIELGMQLRGRAS